MDVFITIDTEIWCHGWQDLDQKFPDAFRRYVYGPTAHGDYALPATLSILGEYGLTASFFVEPVFSARFGLAPLQEMVGLIQAANQEVQLHLHPEWLDEAREPVVDGVSQKIPQLTLCNATQQQQLVRWGLQRLAEAGADNINAFRAGSYAANTDTLRALQSNGIAFDTSYNLSGVVGVADMAPGQVLLQPSMQEGVCVYPVSVLALKDGSYRNVQVTALSYHELVDYLERAHDAGWSSVVIVSHNFEMLTPDKRRVDQTVARRFNRLCRYLDSHRDRYQVKGFHQADVRDVSPQPSALSVKPVLQGLRYAEQAWRTLRYR